MSRFAVPLAIGLTALAGCTSDGISTQPAGPTFDATGDWTMQMSGPELVSGDCDVVDDEGYAQTAHIDQSGAEFTIAVGEGVPAESGTIKGSTYTHGSEQQGLDPSGMPFVVNASSTFELESAAEAVGETTLEIDYGDGTTCIFALSFTGARI